MLQINTTELQNATGKAVPAVVGEMAVVTQNISNPEVTAVLEWVARVANAR